MRQPNEKSHRNRKNPRSAEIYREQNREQNAARPKQERIETVLEVGNSKVVKIIGPFREG